MSCRVKIKTLFFLLIFIPSDCLAQNRIDELIDAALQGDLDTIMEAMRDRPFFNVNVSDDSGNTMLMAASYKDRQNVFEFLLKMSADLDAKNRHGTTALMAAVGWSNEAIVRQLLDRGADPNVRNNNDDTALMIAIRYEKVDVIDDLLLAGAYLEGMDIYSTQNSDFSLELIQLACSVDRLDIVQYLVETEVVDVNAQSETGLTPLMFAGMYNAIDIARYLLERGADPNVQNNDGGTALILAVGNIEVLDILLEAGADPNIAMWHDITNNNVVENITRGNNTNSNATENMIRRNSNITALMLASFSCNANIVHRLLENGADPYQTDYNGHTARMWVSTSDHSDSYNCLRVAQSLVTAMLERYPQPSSPPSLPRSFPFRPN